MAQERSTELSKRERPSPPTAEEQKKWEETWRKAMEKYPKLRLLLHGALAPSDRI